MTQGATSRLLLIDLSNVYWASWHATADQELSTAFENTVATVRALAEKADLVAVCCDSRPYWRSELLPAYKAHRAEAPPLALEQFERVKERLRADGFLLWAAPTFEADDVIAWATVRALDDASIERVVIASADKDLHQLVSLGNKVVCYSPMKREHIGREAVIEKHGVPPEQMLDYLSLIGDSSDNVPGVPGVGPKNASALLGAFRDLEGVLAEAAKSESESGIKRPAIKRALVEHADAARLARKLIALRTDVPLKWEELRMERKQEPLAETPEIVDEPAKPAEPPQPSNGTALAFPEEQKAAPAPTPIIARSNGEWSLALEPQSSAMAWNVATALFNSRLYQQLGSREAIFAVLMRGRALGLDATTALSAFHCVQGRLTMHADLIEALVLRSGKAEYFEMVESTPKVARYATKRVGNKREQEMAFTIEDAAAAGLVVKDPNGQDGYSGRNKEGKAAADANWSKYRAVMLRHRCKTQLARAVYADVVMGLYMPEEMEG